MEIDKLIKYATLDKAGAAKEAYRAIKAELLLNSSSKTPKPEGKIVNSITFSRGNDSFDIKINELDLSIIRKLIKEREEQISIYEANSRKDLADMYKEQRDILKVFLPPEVSLDDIKELILSLYPTGYTVREMGKVIKSIKEVYPTADMSKVSSIVKNSASL